MAPATEVVRINEARERLIAAGVQPVPSESTLRRMWDDGEFGGRRTYGGHRLFDVSALDDLAEQ